MIAAARSPQELGLIVDQIHDHWLDIDGVALRDDSLEIPVSDHASRRATQETQFRWALVIRHVEGWSFDDQAQVGYYDINKLEYDASQRVLHLRCGAPLVISAQVSEIDVSLEDRSTSPL